MAESAGLARRLGTADAVMIGLGSMIGAGVFPAFAPAAAAAGAGLLIGLVLAAVVAFCNATARRSWRRAETGLVIGDPFGSCGPNRRRQPTASSPCTQAPGFAAPLGVGDGTDRRLLLGLRDPVLDQRCGGGRGAAGFAHSRAAPPRNGSDGRTRTAVVGIDLAARTLRARDLDRGGEYDEPFDDLVYARGQRQGSIFKIR